MFRESKSFTLYTEWKHRNNYNCFWTFLKLQWLTTRQITFLHIVSPLTGQTWRKVTDTAKEQGVTETRRKKKYQQWDSKSAHQCQYWYCVLLSLLFPFPFVHLSIVLHFTWWSYMHLFGMVSDKLWDPLVTLKHSSQKNKVKLQTKILVHCKQ